MNNQPYRVPDKHWPPRLSYWWFRVSNLLRKRALRSQQMGDVKLEGVEYLRLAVSQKKGVLIAPNHSFHWDSYCLLEAAYRLSIPFYMMTAWQVFSESNWLDRLSMQRCGCFSVDREGTDTQSLKTAIDILQHRAEPLVIFPEGDVYHTNDRITSFREGAAAIAILAAKKSERPIAVLPTAIKRWYVEDPTPSILNTLNALEKKLAIAPNPGGNLVDRVLKVGDELLATKESEFLGERHHGALAERTANLAEFILRNAEVRYGIPQPKSILPERVKEVRRRVIQEQLTLQAQDPKKAASLKQDLDQMFLVTQLYSYPGDYILENPSIERIAETLDKLEEDFLDIPYPSVRGKRMVTIRFGTPIELPPGAHRPDRMEGSEESRKIRDRKYSPSELTEQMQYGVQMMIDQLNEEHRQNSHDAPRIS